VDYYRLQAYRAECRGTGAGSLGFDCRLPVTKGLPPIEPFIYRPTSVALDSRR